MRFLAPALLGAMCVAPCALASRIETPVAPAPALIQAAPADSSSAADWILPAEIGGAAIAAAAVLRVALAFRLKECV